MKLKFLLYILLFVPLFGIAQNILPDGRTVTLTTTIGEDTIPFINLPEVEIKSKLSEEDLLRLQAYKRLKRDVKKAYPYAKLAGAQIKEIEIHVGTLKNERQKRKYIKAKEKELKEQFTEELKNLTVNQGRILMKLVDRETGTSSYDLVKELKGSLSAFFWQGMARLFGSSLKSTYDPNGEDSQIEDIVVMIENGQF